MREIMLPAVSRAKENSSAFWSMVQDQEIVAQIQGSTLETDLIGGVTPNPLELNYSWIH